MSNITNSMDSVFAGSTEEELEFDVMFDQEDSLIDTVNGVNENGDPLTGVDFEDLHQTQDNSSVECLKDVQSDDEPMGAKDMEGTDEPTQDDNSVKGELGKKSDADDFHGNAEEDYQEKDEKNPPKPDDGDVTKTIDNVIESGDIDEELDGDDDPIEEGADPEEGEVPEDKPVDEGCGKKSCKEGAEEDMENEDKAVSEGGDIDDELDSEMEEDLDDKEIDSAVAEEAGESGGKYAYDVSDEDLIDAAINGD